MDYSKIMLALDLAVKAHNVQQRRGVIGAYIHHPVAVARMVFKAGLSEDAVIAAILHDTVEDTWVTIEHLMCLDWVSDRVIALVYGMTKQEARGETSSGALARVIESGDKELICIKLFDVAHNLQVAPGDYWPGMEESLISYRARTKKLLVALKKV